MGTLQEDKSKLFSSDTYRGPVQEIEIDGVELEIRCPKVKHTFKNLGDKGKKLIISSNADFRELLLECVFHKESGKAFFNDTDLEALEESAGHPSGIIGQIGEAIQSLADEEVAKTVESLSKNS